MATYVFTSPEGKKYRISGDGTQEEAFAELQRQLQTSNQVRLDVPQISPSGEITFPGEKQPQQVNRSIPEKLKGAGETGLALATGATTGVAGHVLGTMKGLAESIRSGKYGTQEGADLVEKAAMDLASKLTYQPKGEAGQEYTQAIGEKLASLQAVAPMAQEMNIIGAGAKNAAKLATSKIVPQGLPHKLYGKAAKFSTTLDPEKKSRIIQTALDYKLLPSKKGELKLNKLLNDFDARIDGMIEQANATGKSIPKKAVFTELGKLRRDVGGAKLEAKKDLKVIRKLAKDFDIHMRKIGKESFTTSELQKFKQNIYGDINWSPGQRAVVNKAKKAIARAAKNSIEKIADVKDLNREFGRLLALEKHLYKSAERIENRNFVGIDAPLKIAAGSSIGGRPGAVAGTSFAILGSPQIKARLAIKLSNIQKLGQIDKIDPKIIPALEALGLYEAGRIGEKNGQ